MTNRPNMLIVGGGLGGLILARILHVNGITPLVLESEPSRQTRVQGGMLDIHAESGQKAIIAAGLMEEFRSIVHAGGEAMRVMDKRARILHERIDEGQFDRPEVERGDLRQLLLDSLPADAVSWGRKVVSAEPATDGGYVVTLADGEVLTADILIGADGAWSRIRPLLTNVEPTYTGISFIETDLLDAASAHPREAEVVGAGMLFALGGAVGIMGHNEPDGSLHIYWGYRTSDTWLDTVDFSDQLTAKQTLVGLMTGWEERLLGLVQNSDSPLVPRRIYALPVGIRWEHRSGVTLIGDAAHLMSPFAGEGVNLALHDASQLAAAIVTHRHSIDTGLARYEAEMFGRAEAAAEQSAQGLDVIFADDAPAGLVDLFRSQSSAAA